MNIRTLKAVSTQILLGAAAAATVFVTASHVQPVFLGRERVMQELLKQPAAEEAALAVAGDLARASSAQAEDSVMALPRFAEDKRKFAEDLMRTGRLEPDRAAELAMYAVREAYLRDVPPALVFGVMLTENDQFKPTAKSSVGAVGLMQIAPRVWVRSLGKLFGTDLRDDETNIQYGVFILGSLLKGHNNATADYAVRKGLLQYNGCVRSRNTPNCHRYPDVVRKRIEQFAKSQCGDVGYNRCVNNTFKLASNKRQEQRASQTE